MESKYIILVVVFVLCFCACRSTNESRDQNQEPELPYYQEATFTPYWFSESNSALDTFHTIGDFSLVNQEGDLITNDSLDGKVYIANFFFTICPGICPQMMTNMMMLQDEFLENENVLLVSHTIMPEHDTIAVLKEYATERMIGADKWHLLTGDREAIYHMGRYEYFIEEDLGLQKEEDDFLHTENFVLIDQNGFIRGIYNGLNRSSIGHLIEDVKLLSK